MLSGFRLCCPALKNMLCGFIFIYACRLRTCYILLSRLAVITRTAPFQTSTGCWFRPNSYNAKAALLAAQSPWWLERCWPSPWATSSRRFPASSGPLGGIVALLEFTFEAQGVICWEEPTSQPSGSSRRSIENICLLPSREINILESLFICLIYRLWR